jgi:hypothetical protein
VPLTWHGRPRRAVYGGLDHDCQVEHERAARAKEVRQRAEEVVRLLSWRRRRENDREDVECVAEEGEQKQEDGQSFDRLALELRSAMPSIR